MNDKATTSRAVADEKLNQLGLGKEPEKKKQTPSASDWDERWGKKREPAYSSYATAKVRDEDVPRFLRKDYPSTNDDDDPYLMAPYSHRNPHSPRPNAKGGATPDSASTRKHAGERTAPHAPHSYIKGEEKFKVSDTLSLPEAAVFSEAAAKFIANRVHEAMADTLQKYGLIWTSAVSLQMKDHIRDSFEHCTFKKDDGVTGQYVAVRIGGNEIDG